MVVGVLTLHLQIPANHSLKGKRSAIRPLLAALSREFGVSAAEVGDQDLWQAATVGVAVASGDRRHADSVLSAVLRRVEGWEGEVLLGQSHSELIALGTPASAGLPGEPGTR